MSTTKEKRKAKYSKKKADEILNDYRIAWLSRHVSYIGRKEVLTGKAKFGIFGDGKELPQIAMAKYFKNGDFRAGYYRDQTLMMAIDGIKIEEFFAQLYANPDVDQDPNSAGRQMNSHFATRLLNEDGTWKSQTKMKNTAADLSPTAAQMPKLMGLAQASKVYRHSDVLGNHTKFTNQGNEVAWGTIGDASTSEGYFWETMNAAGVMQVPMIVSVWDDGYGISVSKKYQTIKENISKALRGFKRTKRQPGLEIITAKAWDYPELVDVYEEAERIAREEHVPVLVHVQEATQPQGHSTSGSHERYKGEDRLDWEEKHCCNRKFRSWILSENIATEDKLDQIENETKEEVKAKQKKAWKLFQEPILRQKDELNNKLGNLIESHSEFSSLGKYKDELNRKARPYRRDIVSLGRKALTDLRGQDSDAIRDFRNWLKELVDKNRELYDSHLYSESDRSPLLIGEVQPTYPNDSKRVDGRVVLRDNFDALFDKYPEVIIFGEDAGQLGDVNLGLEGMQEKYGELRVSDTGIREATILGQGIGLALRGLRPIAEIQYLDYLLYCFQGLSDDLATLRYRTKGGQAAPVIVRTRGHRLEGIWHSGSPMGVILNGLRGIHVCVPSNLTDAAGFYNTLLQGDDPALIIEPLNAYRLKEKLPDNLGEFTVPLGVPTIKQKGDDITVVSYGSTLNLVHTVLPDLKEAGITVELIDVRTLLPFDLTQVILESLKKTNRILFVDEDVPGGATAFMMQQVIGKQKGYYQLDSEAKCLSAKAHRTPYASDGDYFTKPNAEDIFETIYGMMSEADVSKYPPLI